MNKITAVIITKNEEKMIRDCLKSISFVDKILVVDDNSTDKTREIARTFKAKVYLYSLSDFSKTRNFALQKVNTDWVLFIDADERVTPLLKQSILKAVKDESVVAYSYQRKNYYLGRIWPQRETVTKLMLKSKLVGFEGIVHEGPKLEGEVGLIKGELLHFTHRNIEDMLNKTIKWSEMEASLRFKANHPQVSWWRLIRVFISGFFNSYVKQKGFKAGIVGFIESWYQGLSLFITYVYLWEMQIKQKK